MTDWTGNANSIFKNHGASNHSDVEREVNDYYATDPNTINDLLDMMKDEPFDNNIWENACGELHMSNRLTEKGYNVFSSDIIKRTPEVHQLDFLEYNGFWHGDIITNPPYKFAKEWVYRSMSTLSHGRKLAMFLKLTFLEGVGRKEMFKLYPPKYVFVYSRRAMCAKNGEFGKDAGNAVAYAWYVWEKGFVGEPKIRWM